MTVIVGDDESRTQLKSALRAIVNTYPYLRDAGGDIDSEQSQASAVEELHDIIDSLFELAPPLSGVLETLQTQKEPNLHALTASYRNLILDKFPNASRYLVLRFADSNRECHEQVRAQGMEKPVPVIDPEAG